MVNITRQLGGIRSGQDRSQSRIAGLNDQYQYAILSGEGSLSGLRDQLSRQMLALGYKRQDESWWVQEQNETKKLFKDLLGLSSLGQG
jgi:hypothetical protein